MSHSADLARQAFRALGAPLRRLRAGTGALEWLRPETIDGLSLDLSGCAPRITVHVDARWPLHLVPRWLDTPHGRIGLRARRAPRPVLQCAEIAIDLPSRNSIVAGSAGFLANDAFSPGGCFVVTAGHVLGGNTLAEFDDPITIAAVNGGIVIERARLAETAVPLGGVVPGSADVRFALDAGLIRLRPDDWRQLADGLPEIVPESIAAPPPGDAPVSVLLPDRKVVRGRARKVDVMASIDVEQYWPDRSNTFVKVLFANLCSSQLDEATEAGNSGAPVRDADNRLIGIHCAFSANDSDELGNALYTPITPILDYFGIVALTEASRATGLVTKPRPPLSAALPRPPVIPPPAPATRPPTNDETVDTLARTLWAEARGEGSKGMEAVACVVLNRVAAPRWWGRTITEVCRKRSQFSCWNEGTSARAALLRVTSADPSFAEALAIAGRAASGQLADFTRGALHYHAIEVLPPWVTGRAPCFSLGRHVFYNDIERRTA